MDKKFVVWFKEVGKEDVASVGGKGANLGEMTQANFPVPPGFIITAQAYYQFIKENNLMEQIHKVLDGLDRTDTKALHSVAEEVKQLIRDCHMSSSLIDEICRAYRALGDTVLVAVRSSATAEDLPNASFAGQQETFLNVSGEEDLLANVKEAWASLFDGRAIFYREENKFDHFKVGIAIPVQKMVESDSSGIMFTIDPVTDDKTRVMIEAIFGLGEFIVQGEVTPDHYEVSKKDGSILVKTIANQSIKMVKRGKGNATVQVSSHDGKKQKITNAQIETLTDLAKRLERHYGVPQDSEWAIENGDVYLVQTRPITTVNAVRGKTEQHFDEDLPIILKGDPASPGIASGIVRILKNADEIDKIHDGDVLVAPQTNPDFVPAMKKAVAIVTDKGGRTSHAAIVSREIGIPAVVGAGNATSLLKDGMEITVNGGTGEVYKGLAKHIVKEEESTEDIKTTTHVYVNLAEPEFADRVAKKHVDGVGLLRAEFMMAAIGKHPKEFIKEGNEKEFIKKLADGLEQFCKAFSPRPVVYRASDFKTNEYRNLTGGKAYEPEEPNPMLGFRGAYRYIHDPEVFRLELEAIKLVRNEKGLENLMLMIPFCRTVEELVKVKALIDASGLKRSKKFKLWMMVEIPSNVILLEDFIKVGIDGVSVGSNDLTMLVLGTDRDNETVASEFDEQNPAVLWALEKVARTAKKYDITASVCGQAVSMYPELLEKLVSWGITSVSVSPDMIEKTRKLISEYEKKHHFSGTKLKKAVRKFVIGE